MNNDSLTNRIAGLSPAKRALFELKLTEKGAFPSAEQTIPRKATRNSAPLSFAQQRLWFLNQLEPESPVYNESTAIRLNGSLDLDALEQALNQIVKRHEVLRTTIVSIDGTPQQVIANSRTVELPVIDLRAFPDKDRDGEAHRLIMETIRRPFDLSRDLMLRLLLLRLAQQEHIFLVVKHHIASDVWSSAILWRELAALYGAFSSGQPCSLPELPVQYADYALWQRDWLQGDVLHSQVSYWRKQLDNITTLQLATDRPRPAVQSFRGASQLLVIARELSEELKTLSRKEGVTLFMTLLAAFQTLLYRYTGTEDIAVGCPIAGRNRAEIEGLIGFFVNTLVLRANLSGNPTFRELLSRVKEVALGAYGHQDVPFEKLVEELQPERNLSYSPLFQIAFALQNVPERVLDLPGLAVSPINVTGATAKFDLHLSIADDPRGLNGRVHYCTDLFDSATITRLLGHYRTLLEGIVANPEQRISDLPLLTEGERRQLFIDWNDTQRDYPKDKCIHPLFEAQVEKSPDAVAVTFENQQLTYRELNERANQLAHYLRKRGVGADVLVAICVERSLEMLVGLLGILKAGGAYVPLDPEYPDERLALMLEDAQPAVLLTQARLMEKLPNGKATLVCLDREWGDIAKETQENPENKTTADNIAYVIYTSGTTGQPKGVMISHHNLRRLFRATEPWFHFSENDVWTMFHSYAFDFSVWEIWGALLHGGRVVVVPFWISRSPEKFYELICREKVTVLNQTPSAFRQLIQADQVMSNRTELALRLVIFGGEALDFQSLEPWLDRHGDQCPQLVNMYGITETTVHVTYRVVRSNDVKERVGSLIGVPLPDLSLYVLDQHGQLVPIGTPGELYVGGAGVGRGYLNRPELTDERFIANPFKERKDDKLYKTGDLVRRLANGDIEYLGRSDAQVKIRGFRVELGEIESVLRQHTGVQEAVAQAREDTFANKILVAYVVPVNKQACSASELRDFLRKKLPEYMVPSILVMLDAVPLTSNGKLDRKALPEPNPGRSDLDEGYAAPRSAVEQMLSAIWAKLLHLKRVGINDDFFDLGGHSLLAVRLLAQIEKLTGKRLPVASLFQAPTIADQARLLSQEGWSTAWKSLVAIQPGGSKPPLFCVHAHDGSVLFWRDLSRRLGPDQPFYALQPFGFDGKVAPYTRIEDMASHYIDEIKSFQPSGPYSLAGHCVGGLIAFEMAQQLQSRGDRVALLALLDSFPPQQKSQLKSNPLLKITLHLGHIASLHLSNFLLLGPGERLQYLQTKCVKLLYKLYMTVGFPWVEAARARRLILHTVSQARKAYHVKPYPGPVTVFRATRLPPGFSAKPERGWARLVAGGLEIRLVPGYFGHTIYEPRVGVLAEQLRGGLDKAQADESNARQPSEPAAPLSTDINS